MTDKELHKVLILTGAIVDCDSTILNYKSNGITLYVRLNNSSEWLEDFEYSVDTEENDLTNSQLELIRLFLIEEKNSIINSDFTSEDYAHFESLIFN